MLKKFCYFVMDEKEDTDGGVMEETSIGVVEEVLAVPSRLSL